MKRIKFFLGDITFKGGIERITTNLANELVDKYDVEIVSVFKTNENIGYNLDSRVKVKFLSSMKYDQKPKSFQRIKDFAINFLRILKFGYTSRDSIIIAQSFPLAFFLFPTVLINKKILVCEHVYYGYYNQYICLLRNFIYRCFARIIVLTEKDKISFQKHINNVECIPNFIEEIDKEEGYEQSSKTIISVGRLEYQKGFDRLINVFKLIEDRYPDWSLKIFGTGTKKNELENQINELNLKNIKLMGTTNDISSEYKKSSFFVCSSRFEGFSLVLGEAAVSGLPLVSFDCPNGPSDIIENNVNGILVENNKEQELFNAMCYLIDNKQKRIEMSNNSRKVIQKFGKEKVIEKWVELFEEEKCK